MLASTFRLRTEPEEQDYATVRKAKNR